jgi:pilus assembly protein CpaC
MSRLSLKMRSMSLAAMAGIVLSVPVMAAQTPQINVIVGQSVTYRHSTTVKTVSISNSDVADVVVAGPQEVLLNGKAIGLTTLVIWDELNNSHMFSVTVRGPFSDQKIELRVKLAEINRTRAMQFGIDVLGQTDKMTAALYPGAISAPSIPLSIFSGPTQGVTGAFQWIDGTDKIQAMIHALEEDGILKILAEPNVIAASGQEANFLAGGEIPVPISVAGAQGGSTITIEWKEYGVKVRFVPTIVDTGVINLVVSPEVSQLDYANAIEITGFKIPAMRTRKADTTVELNDRETLVISGLIMEAEDNVRVSLPILGRIPLLGWLFSDTRKVKSESELLIVVSPHLVRALPPGAAVKLPGQEEEEEN